MLFCFILVNIVVMLRDKLRVFILFIILLIRLILIKRIYIFLYFLFSYRSHSLFYLLICLINFFWCPNINYSIIFSILLYLVIIRLNFWIIINLIFFFYRRYILSIVCLNRRDNFILFILINDKLFL